MEQISGTLLVIHIPLSTPLFRERKADDQERVLKDASMMIPRTKVNLARAVEELDDLVVSLYSLGNERIKAGADGRTHLRVMRRSRGVKSLKLLPIN